MILLVNITKERKKALLSRYPDIKYFIDETADRIIIERGQSDIDKELKEYRDRRALNSDDFRKREVTQATKDKISKTLKAKGWKGIPLLEETRQKMIGHIVTKETREAISKGNKGQKRSEEQRQNLSLGHKGMKYKKKLLIIK